MTCRWQECEQDGTVPLHVTIPRVTFAAMPGPGFEFPERTARVEYDVYVCPEHAERLADEARRNTDPDFEYVVTEMPWAGGAEVATARKARKGR